jgi:hypothetical protein
MENLGANGGTLEIEAPTEAVHTALNLVAEGWGGQWKDEAPGGELWIPVNSGLRKGFWHGTIDVEALPADTGACRLRVEQRDQQMQVNRGAAMILLFGAVGGVVAILWPFFPALVQLGPFGLVLAIAAWLLVSSRIRNSGLEEFFRAVEAVATGAEAAG